jgi:alpha-D-ribose 1-methylphosphonate 5-triphosphate synthase subunit PhnI
MWETLITVGSGGLGGLLRLAPEIMKGFDRKHERAHELAMMQVEIQIVEKRLEHEMRKVDAAMTMAEMDAISQAVKEQGQTARAAGKFVAAVSALVHA